jgi:hypothetical protein
MANEFTKGTKPGPGRPKGSVNKATKEIKDMILEALDNAGGAEYLEKRANDPRTASAFLGLVGKVLPMQITGKDGGPIAVEKVVREIVDAK